MEGDAEPEVSMRGMTGPGIPYGGDPRICCRQSFVKREIIMTCALMISWFDVEVLELGGLWVCYITAPTDNVPFRMRRRMG